MSVRTTFKPELGQMLTAGWYEIEGEPHVEEIVRGLGVMVYALGLCAENPCANTGVEYANHVFAIRAFCWCEGDTHGEECPPNFQCGDFRAAWYKHSGRGFSQSRSLSRDAARRMVRVCVRSLVSDMDRRDSGVGL